MAAGTNLIFNPVNPELARAKAAKPAKQRALWGLGRRRRGAAAPTPDKSLPKSTDAGSVVSVDLDAASEVDLEKGEGGKASQARHLASWRHLASPPPLPPPFPFLPRFSSLSLPFH